MLERKVIRCGKFFDASTGEVHQDHTLFIEGEEIAFSGPSAGAPSVKEPCEVIDHSDSFVMPGLIDVHVHLSYGEAKTEEDIDLFSSLEFRAIRGMEAAQRVLRAGYTSICDPTTSGRVSLAVRDAIDSNLFEGPKLTCSGRNISTRQGLVDWYPTWIGVPETSIGQIVKNTDEGIDAIREQVKDGVDFIKLAMDGDSMNPASIRLACAFRQEEVDKLVDEAHRLGRKVVVHARGSDGVLYAARAGVDMIFHASWMNEEGLEEVLKRDIALCPSLNLLVNNIEFTAASDPAAMALVDAHKRELETAVENLQRARKAGARFLVGSEGGFAVTPYGEWHARELQNHVDYLGFTPKEALCQATRNNAWFTRHDGKVGTLAPGSSADILVLKGDPTADIGVPLAKENIEAVFIDGRSVDLTPNDRRERHPTEFSYTMWNNVYTQSVVQATRAGSQSH